MANIDRLAPKILKWEGGFSDHPADRGGATNMGITIATWKRVGYDKDGDGDIDVRDLKMITKADALKVLRIYWDRWRADSIMNQSVADILVDWVWGSGKWGIVIPQRILGVKQDGIVGVQTITALNAANQFSTPARCESNKQRCRPSRRLTPPIRGNCMRTSSLQGRSSSMTS